MPLLLLDCLMQHLFFPDSCLAASGEIPGEIRFGFDDVKLSNVCSSVSFSLPFTYSSIS